MGLLIKLLLFICAYSPLISILFITSITDLSPINILICLTPILFSVMFGLFIFYKNKSETGENSYRVKSVNDKTSDVVSYIVPYIMSVISIEINDIRGMIIIIILLILLFAVYANSPLIYMNPLLSLFHYKIYQVELIDYENSKLNKVMLISKKSLKENDTISICDLSDEVYLQVNV